MEARPGWFAVGDEKITSKEKEGGKIN